MESTYKINPKRFVYDTKMIIDEKLCKYTRKQLGRYKSGISITFTTYYLFYFSLFRPLTKRSG